MQSSVGRYDRHWGCFHLGHWEECCRNTRSVSVFSRSCFQCFRYILRSEMLTHMVVSIFNFWGTYMHCFFCSGCTFCIPLQLCTKFNFSIFSNICCLFSVLYCSHLKKCEVVSHWFSLALPWWSVLLSNFSYTCWLHVSPWRNVFSSPLSIFKQIICLFICFCSWVICVPYLFWVIASVIYGLQIFSPTSSVAFSLGFYFLCLAEPF